MMKIADSATIRHAIPTTPRYGNTHGASRALIGIVLVVCVIRNSRPDLPDVSNPTAAGGCSQLVQRQSYKLAAAKAWPTPASTHPTDHVPQSRPGNTPTPG